eukprot:1154634-Pelagomonas_calceolata.AAC.2
MGIWWFVGHLSKRAPRSPVISPFSGPQPPFSIVWIAEMDVSATPVRMTRSATLLSRGSTIMPSGLLCCVKGVQPGGYNQIGIFLWRPSGTSISKMQI